MGAAPVRDANPNRNSTSAARLLLPWIELADGALDLGREYGARLLDNLQAQLNTLRARLDPDLDRWIAEAHTSVADGSLRERIRTQPAPAALAEELKQARRTD